MRGNINDTLHDEGVDAVRARHDIKCLERQPIPLIIRKVTRQAFPKFESIWPLIEPD
jgi:hypothetical protein